MAQSSFFHEESPSTVCSGHSFLDGVVYKFMKCGLSMVLSHGKPTLSMSSVKEPAPNNPTTGSGGEKAVVYIHVVRRNPPG